MTKMVKKRKSSPKSSPKAKIGIVIYTPQGMLVPSAATLAKMKAAQKKSK